MRGYLPRFFILSTLSLLLTACGGGGGGGSALGGDTGDGTGTGGGSAGTPTLTLTVVDSNGDSTNSVTGNTPVTVRALAQDGSGSTVSGLVVSFNSDVGQLTPATGNVLTGSDGIAEISLGAGTIADAGEVSATATINGVAVTSNSVGIQTDGGGSGVGSTAINVDFVLSTPDNSITISRDNPGTGTVTVTDSSGAAVSQAVVQFSANNGVLDPASGAVATNSSGVATISLLAGTNAGAGVLSAQITSGSETVDADNINFITEGDSVATLALTIPSGNQTTAVSNAAPVTITATVIDDLGAPVEGAIVTFSKSGSNAVLSRTTDITNASGVATTNLLAGTTSGLGEVTASVTVNGVSVSSADDNTISFNTAGDGPFDGEGTSNLSIAVSLVQSVGGAAFTGAIDADRPAVLQAVVTDATGAPLSNTVVEFSTDGVGDIFPISGLALTNSSGIASVALNAGSTPGAGVATARIVIDGARFDSDSVTFTSNGNAGDTEIVLTLTFTDATPGNGSNIITKQDNATVSILVEDGDGNNLPLRTATITTSLGTVSADGGTAAQTITATTDSDGRIEVLLEAGDNFGTGDFVATVGDTSATVQFDVGVAGLQIGTCSGGSSAVDCSSAGANFTGFSAPLGTGSVGSLNISTSPLSAGGTATVTLIVVDADGTPVPNIDISFSTNCSNQTDADSGLPLASISQEVTSNSSGVVQATYQASGCVGNDNITAEESSTGETATGTINVLAPTIGSIVFDSVNDSLGNSIDSIFIQESGGESTARVVFQVLDVFGDPAEDEDVRFELTSNVGGIELQNTTGLTDSEGKATAFVNSGFIATTVRVRASIDIDTNEDNIDDTTLVTLSGQLSVNTGIADQNSFSLSFASLNFAGGDIDGNEVLVNVKLADKFNNPVPDGTSVNFRTEFGRITPSCNTSAGDCSVTLNSQEPRGPLDPNTTVKDLNNASCPSELVFEESVTVSGTSGDTNYVVNTSSTGIARLETAGDVALTEGVDFTEDSDGSGFSCLGGACVDGATLKVTYVRAYLDEDQNNTTTHTITNPGQATAPFRSLTGIPCTAPSRSGGGDLSSGYIGGLGQIAGGRSTILATAQGEESFVDSNGNGLYDFNEPFVDLTEAFHDYNEDNVFGNGTVGSDDSRDSTSRGCYGPNSPITNPSETLGNCYQVGGDEEEFIDFGDGTTLNNRFDAGNGIYNGTLCPKAISDRTDTCNNNSDPCDEATERYCTRDLVNIRRSGEVIFSTSDVLISYRDSATGERISAVDLLNVGSGRFTAGQSITANDGTTIASGTEFYIGHASSVSVTTGSPPVTTVYKVAPPQIGDTVSLTSGSGSVRLEYADRFNQKLPAGTTVTFGRDDTTCLISNSPNEVVPSNSSSTEPDSAFIALSADSARASGTGNINVTFASGNNSLTYSALSCSF